MTGKCCRCGRCCEYTIPGQLPKRCRYLIGEIGKITSCRIYKNRIGTKIEPGVICLSRQDPRGDANRDIEGCTFVQKRALNVLI